MKVLLVLLLCQTASASGVHDVHDRCEVHDVIYGRYVRNDQDKQDDPDDPDLVQLYESVIDIGGEQSDLILVEQNSYWFEDVFKDLTGILLNALNKTLETFGGMLKKTGTYDMAKEIFGPLADLFQEVFAHELEMGSAGLRFAYGEVKNAGDLVVKVGGKTLDELVEHKKRYINKTIINTYIYVNTTVDEVKNFLIKADNEIMSLNDTLVQFPLDTQLVVLAYHTVRNYTIEAWNNPLMFLISNGLIPFLFGLAAAGFVLAGVPLLATLATGIIVSLLILYFKFVVNHYLENVLKKSDPEAYEAIMGFLDIPIVQNLLWILEVLISMVMSRKISGALAPSSPKPPKVTSKAAEFGESFLEWSEVAISQYIEHNFEEEHLQEYVETLGWQLLEPSSFLFTGIMFQNDSSIPKLGHLNLQHAKHAKEKIGAALASLDPRNYNWSYVGL